MTYWKIKHFKQLLEIEKDKDLNEVGTVTRGYLHDIDTKIRLMEEAYKEGLKVGNSTSYECGHCHNVIYNNDKKDLDFTECSFCDCKKFTPSNISEPKRKRIVREGILRQLFDGSIQDTEDTNPTQPLCINCNHKKRNHSKHGCHHNNGVKEICNCEGFTFDTLCKNCGKTKDKHYGRSYNPCKDFVPDTKSEVNSSQKAVLYSASTPSSLGVSGNINDRQDEPKMKTRKDIVVEIEEYRKSLRKENVEKSITDLIELLYGKLSDEDVRILEIFTLRRKLEGFDMGVNQEKSEGKKDDRT